MKICEDTNSNQVPPQIMLLSNFNLQRPQLTQKVSTLMTTMMQAKTHLGLKRFMFHKGCVSKHCSQLLKIIS